MQRVLVLPFVVLLCVSCGGRKDSGADIVARAQRSLRHLDDSRVALRVSVQSPVRIQRHFDVRARELPLMKIQLTRWTRNPQRIRCSSGLECARADIDTKAALRAFRPLLPQLPVNPKDVQSARVDVAVTESGRLRYLHVSGDLKVLLVEVPFQAALDVEH